MCGCWGGMHGCSRGGMHGCSGGACVVTPGGHAWLLPGGVHGCSGGMHGFFDEIRSMSGRYASYWNAYLLLLYPHVRQLHPEYFDQTSTWFTVITAVSRYFVVTRPNIVRQYMRCCQIAVAIVLCFVTWILLFIPCGFRYKMKQYACPEGAYPLLLPGLSSQTELCTFLSHTCGPSWGLSFLLLS